MYKVSGMLALCRQWIKEHVLEANLYSMIELGLELEVLGNGDVLELCKMFIIGTVKDGLFLLSQGWDLNNKHSFVKFLLDKDMLYFTLPLVTSWVSCDADIRYILELIECKELVFFGARATDLIQKMSDKMELVETSRRIITLRISNVKEGSSTKEVGHDATSTSTEVAPGLGQLLNPAQCFSPQPNADLSILLKQDYKSFTASQMLEIEEWYGLRHFEFVDIVLTWLETNKPSQEDMFALWGKVRREELEATYYHWVLNVLSLHSQEALPTQTDCVRERRYKYYGSGDYLTDIIKGNTIMKCGFYQLSTQLSNTCPCYEEDMYVPHWYMLWWDVCGLAHFYSLVTHAGEEFKMKVNLCVKYGHVMYLGAMHQWAIHQ